MKQRQFYDKPEIKEKILKFVVAWECVHLCFCTHVEHSFHYRRSHRRCRYRRLEIPRSRMTALDFYKYTNSGFNESVYAPDVDRHAVEK